MPTRKSAHQFSQPEREAIVDLLHLCIYADAHIGGKESDYVAKVVTAIGWDTKLSFSGYEPRSIASARAARSDATTLKDFLSRAAARLESKEARRFAVSKCADLAAEDGTHHRESTLLAQIKEAIKV